MKKLVVFMSIAIFAIALGGCKKEAETIQDAPAEQIEKVQTAAEETPVQKEPAAQEEKPAVVAEEAKPEPPAAAEAVVEESAPDAVVVTVNGQEITEEKVSDEVEKRIEVQKKRMPPGMEMPETMKQQVRSRVVDMEIEKALLNQEMNKSGLVVSDEQVLDEIKKIAGQQNKSVEEVEAEVAKMGMTMEDIKGQIQMQMQVDALMKSKSPESTVTEADAQKFYDENPQHFTKPEQVKASHILCGKRGIKEEEYPAELEKIKAAKARLDAGEAFEVVAKEVSTCPSGGNGGDLGFFGKGQMDPAFEKAAFELEAGQTTDIVKTSFGYHIIKVTDKNEGGTTPFAEAKDQIVSFLERQKQQAFWAEYSKTMRDAAAIQYSEKEQAARDAMEKAAAEQAAARQAQMEKMRAAQAEKAAAAKAAAEKEEAAKEPAAEAEKTE